MSGPVRSVLRQSASLEHDYSGSHHGRDRRNSVRFNLGNGECQPVHPAHLQNLQSPQGLQQNAAPQQQHLQSANLNPQAVTNATNHPGGYQGGYHGHGLPPLPAYPPSANQSPPQVMSPSQFAMQLAQAPNPPQQQFVYQTNQQPAVLSPTTMSSTGPQVMFNYSVPAPYLTQPSAQQPSNNSPILVKSPTPLSPNSSSKFAPLSIKNTDDPKWHKWVELINQYWNEMATLG